MEAEETPVGRPAGPRIWPALTVLFLVAPSAVAVQIPFLVVIVVVLVARGGEEGADLPALIERVASLPLAFLVVLVVAQLVFAAAAFLPARLSPVPFARRLGFVRGRLPAVGYPLAMGGTIFTLYLGELLWDVFYDQPSANLMALARAFADAPLVLGLLLLVVASVMPGLFEEALCRGYVQRRLLERWHPALAIGLTSTVFAWMHFDPQHVVSVLPVAFWLGYVAWRADSTWPGVACHFFVNVFAQSHLVFGGELDPAAAAEPIAGGWWLLATVPAFVGAVLLLERAGRGRGAGPAAAEPSIGVPGGSL